MNLDNLVNLKAMIKAFFKYTTSMAVVTVSVVGAYYLCCLHDAKKYTHEVIQTDLKSAQWRHPNGACQAFELFSHDLNARQKEILIKVQDPGFHHHKGIDLSTPGAGLTTVTQAIVKKLYFDDFKPGIAKIKQSLIARFVVNDMISKDDQLTLFINTMFFGNVHGKPLVGLESAAIGYYQMPLKKLTEDQYISIIAMLVMPGTFHILDHPEWNKERCRRIKTLITGEYKPKGLMDQFYGELPQEVVNAGLPPASYFGDSFKIMGTDKDSGNKVDASD